MNQSNSLPEEFRYSWPAVKSATSMKELKFHLFVNAISATRTLEHAALELGCVERTVITFVSQYDIDQKTQQMMRRYFKATKNDRVKYKFPDLL